MSRARWSSGVIVVLTLALVWLLALGAAPVASAPNDTHFAEWQWALKKIKAPKAWGVTRGKGAVIAVVDSGADLTHPDLAARLIVNPDADFVEPDETDGPLDERGHGTHVAGIAGAIKGNGIGIVGVAPKAKILPVRVLNENGEGDIANGAEAIRYAADHGADVINLSFGVGAGTSEVYLLTGDLDPLHDAIDYAWEQGAVLIGAAGNQNYPFCVEPATADHVMCIGATGPADQLASYSNFDATGVDTYMVAPGGEQTTLNLKDFILSTMLRGKEGAGSPEAGYDVNLGTSMAAPHVSGVAALLSSRGLDNQEIVDCLTSTALDLGDPGRDGLYGYGRLRANRAVRTC